MTVAASAARSRPYFSVQVLDHLLAPLVLEVHVDVRRLVPFPRDEALEQHAHAGRIDLRDAEGVAHRGISGRAAPLAQDAAAARELHDVVDGEEVRLVAQLRDERELVLDQLTHAGGHAGGKARAQSLLGDLSQVRGRRVARGRELLRVLVAQAVEGEGAALRDAHSLGQQPGRVELREPHAHAQVPLGVGVERAARFGHRRAQPDRGQRVLQRAARAHVHVHVAGRHQRQLYGAAEIEQRIEPRPVVRPGEEFRRDPGAAGKGARDALRVFEPRLLVRSEQHEAAGDAGVEIVPPDAIASLWAPAPRRGDELRQVAVRLAVGCEQHQLRPVREPELGADDEL